jgi:hypothetical protein
MKVLTLGFVAVSAAIVVVGVILAMNLVVIPLVEQMIN